MVSKASIPGILLLLMAVMAHAGSIPPAQVMPLIDKYVVRSWSVLQGLPENEVRDLAFASDGYLWIVTPHGLCRFDGVQFDCPLPQPPVGIAARDFRGLCFDRRGVLWVYGTGGAWSYRSSGWEAIVDDSKKLPLGHEILKLGQAADGTFWLLVSGGLYAWDGRSLRSYPLPVNLPSHVHLADMTIDPQGTIWLAAMDRVLRFDQGRYEPSPLPDLPTGNPPAIWHIYTDSAGRVWTATHAELFVRDNGAWRVVPSPNPASRWVLPGKFWEAADGSLWIAGRESLSRLHEGRWWRTYQEKEMDFPLVCRTVVEDSEGNIWVGIDGGLVRLSPRLAQSTFVTPDELGTRRVSTLTVQGRQELLVGFQSGEIAAGYAGLLQQQGNSPAFPKISAKALLRDSEGYWWIGSQGTYLLRIKDRDIRWVGLFSKSNVPRAYQILALRQTADGTFWAGTNDGLMRILDPHASGKNPTYFSPEGGIRSSVPALHEDREGNLWVGYESEGLARRAPNGKIQQFRESDGLPGPGVYAIWKDDDGVLWLGGRHGLARWEGENHWVVPAECGFGEIPVTQIVEDEQKRLWLGTPNGVWCLSRAELAEMAVGKRTRLHARRLGVDEGMPSDQCTGSFNYTGAAPPKNRLWFGTARGLVSFLPRMVLPSGRLPELRLQSVSVSGREIWRAPLFSSVGTVMPKELTLAPGSRQIRIAFTGFHYASPDQLRFSYRLSGPSAGTWSPLSRDRVAQFEYLPAGSHELRVVACSSDGAWNETGVSLVLNVRPWFWQTGWFFLTVLLAAGMVTGWAVRMIIRRRWKMRLHRMEKEMAVQQERSRIARDIHDELGAGLSEVTLLSELVQRPDAPPARTQERLRRMFQRAGELTRSVDEIVWAINPTNDNLRSFVVYIIEYSREFLALVDIPCRLNIPDVLPPMPINANVRHELCMVIKECLSNIVKHAGATEVSIGMNLDGRRLAICIEDNGCGFDPLRVDCDAGHDGLANMRRRMEKLSSECRIDSEPGKGTRVRLWYDVGTSQK